MPNWSAATNVPESFGGSAGAVADGTLVLGAGFDGDSTITDALYAYGASADQWSSLTASYFGRESPGAAGNSTHFFSLGGRTSSGTVVNQAFKIDIANDERDAMSYPPQDTWRTAAAANDSYVWLLGGRSAGSLTYAEVYEYDISADSWTQVTPMNDSREFHDAVYFDGYVYTAGGIRDDGTVLSAAERYDPATDSWSQISSMPASVEYCRLAHDRTYVYVHTSDFDGANPAVYRYDPSADSWTTIETPAEGHTGGAFGGIKPDLLLAGGSVGAASASAEARDGSYEPLVPQTLTAAQSGSDIALSWDDVPEETEYRIYRATSTGSTTADYTQVDTVAADTTSYTDTTGLTEGVEYFYRVTAANAIGESDPSNEATAIALAPAPTFDALTVVNGDELDCTGTDNATDETAYRVLLSTDGGTTFTNDSGDLAADTTAYTTGAKRDGEQYTVKIRAVFADTVADSAAKQATTDLPDVAVDDITPIDASVEDELTVPNADVADYGDVRYQIRVAGSGAAYGANFADVVVAQDGAAATFAGLADGEKYDVRARSETEHVDGTYVEVAEVTKLPAPSITPIVGATSVTLSIIDNADNEDVITVDRRREYSDGFGAWSEIASLAPDTTSYTDDTVLPGTTYGYRVTNETEHAMSATTVQLTTDSLRPDDAAPTSGWYVEVDGPNGTRSFTPVGTPQREPALNGLERVTIPAPKDEAWSEPAFDDATIRVWYGGERLPIEELQGRKQQPGRTDLYAEGGTDLYVPDRYEFSNTDMHAAFGDVVDDTPYAATITAPEADNREFDTVDDNEAFADYLESTADTFPVVVAGGDLRAAQTNFWIEAEDEVNSGVTENIDYGSGDPQWSGAQAVDLVTSSVSTTITTDHTIPAADFDIAIRLSTEGPPDDDGVEGFDGRLIVSLDGTEISRLAFDDSTVVNELFFVDAGTTNGVTSDVAAGEHTLTFEVEGISGIGLNGAFYLDGAAIYDARYHDYTNWAMGTWDAQEYYNDPPLFPPGGLDVVLLHEGFLSATGARVEAAFDDTSGNQALALSNDYGSTYATASNTDTLETDFASPGADIQMRVTLDAYGSRTLATPLDGFTPQTLQSYTLFEDIRDSPPLQNDQFSGDRTDILTALVERGDALWGLSWDRDAEQIVVEMTNTGDRVSDRDLDLVEYEWTTETLGRQVEWADIRGGAQTVRAESITADTVNEVSLAHDNLIAGREQVRDASSGEVYTRGTDYSINYLLGNVQAESTGTISDGQSLVIDYEWKPKGEFALGGVDEKKKLARTFVGANTDAICRSIAYYLVQELGGPIESGTAVIPELPPGYSVLEALSASALPQRGDWTLRGPPTVQNGRVELPIANRQRVEDLVNDIQGRLDQHGDRI